MTAPLLVGVYKNSILTKQYATDERTSEILPKIFKEIDEKYAIKSLFFAKGPGSFMSIKISYIFLKSYSIVKNIPLKAVDGFYFNNNSPIKSIGKMFFIKDGDNIILDTIKESKLTMFKLPEVLKKDDFSLNSTPLYILPAV